MLHQSNISYNSLSLLAFSCIATIAILAFLFIPSSASALCNDVNAESASGTYTVTGSCSFSGAGGVGGNDQGDIIINTGVTVTINANETVAWNSGFSITLNGTATIVKSASGAVLKKTNLWIQDADGDGYASSTVQLAQDSDPGGDWIRRNLSHTYGTADIDDTDNTCAINKSCYASVTSCIPDDLTTECVLNTCASGGFSSSPLFFTVFVTSASSTGNLGGTSGADTTCNSIASGAGLSGTYTAWASVSNSTEPRDRSPFSDCATAGASSTAWYLPDGTTQVASDYLALINTDTIPLDNVIDQDETATAISGSTWTNVKENGANNSSNDCVNWTDARSSKAGEIGSLVSTDVLWTSLTTGTCDSLRSLYCFQGAP